MSEQEKKSWFRKAVDEYNKFCSELGLDKGSCRGVCHALNLMMMVR